MTATGNAPTARFGAQQRKGVLLGFSGPRLVVLAGALIATVTALFTGDFGGLLVISPLLGVFLASAFVRIDGRAAIEWAPVAGHWALRRCCHQDVYLARPSMPRTAGTLALPGDVAALRVHIDTVTGAALVHDPHRHTLSAICTVTHPAFVLLDGDDQIRRVTAWGRVLALLGRSGNIAAIQVLETTMPDKGAAVLNHWRTHGARDGSWAATTYSDFLRSAAPTSARHQTAITVSLDMRKAGRAIAQAGHGLAAATAVLRQQLTILDAALRAADLHPVGWLNERQLAAHLRAAYDGGSDPAREHCSLTTAGPVGIREHWSWLELERSAAAVLWISEWPRSAAHPNFLHSLLLHPSVRKSVSLLAKPVPTADARRDIRRQKVEYLTDADQKSRLGQIADLSDRQEYQDILDREAEINAGHTDMRFTGLIAITAADKQELDAALAQIEQAALHADCETRLLVGQQAQAFAAAALPLARGIG